MFPGTDRFLDPLLPLNEHPSLFIFVIFDSLLLDSWLKPTHTVSIGTYNQSF